MTPKAWLLVNTSKELTEPANEIVLIIYEFYSILLYYYREVEVPYFLDMYEFREAYN
jgi:hypothetical protein